MEDTVNKATLQVSNQTGGTAGEAGRSRTSMHKRGRSKVCLDHEKAKGRKGMEQVQ